MRWRRFSPVAFLFGDYMTQFLKLETGSNSLRILTDPYQYYAHEAFVPKGGSHYGQRQMCSGFLGESCALCNTGSIPAKRWIVGVMSSRFEQARLLDFNRAAFLQLKNIYKQSNWGKFEDYNVDFYIDVEYTDQTLQIIPQPKWPMTESELLVARGVMVEELQALTVPTQVVMDYEKIEVKLSALEWDTY